MLNLEKLHKLDKTSTADLRWVDTIRNGFIVSASGTNERVGVFASQACSKQAICLSQPIPAKFQSVLNDDCILLELLSIVVAFKALKPIFKKSKPIVAK